MRIIFTNGVFDLLHQGHLHLLKEAKALGDFLVVALNTDRTVRELKGPGRPIQDEMTRYQNMKAVPFVDYVVLFNQLDPEFIIEALPFPCDIVVKGSDYRREDVITGNWRGRGIPEVRIIEQLSGFSTTAIIGNQNGRQRREAEEKAQPTEENTSKSEERQKGFGGSWFPPITKSSIASTTRI